MTTTRQNENREAAQQSKKSVLDAAQYQHKIHKNPKQMQKPTD